jgi:MFS family permease
MWLVAFVMVAVYALGNVPAPLYEIYRREFGFSEVVLTLVYAAYVAGTVAAMLFAGGASDRSGRRPPIFISLAVGVVAAIVFLFAASTPWLFVARVLTGLSVGVGTAAATAWIVELHPRNDRAAANRVALGGNLLGLALGPIVAGLMAAYLTSPLRLPYGFSLALLLVASLVACFAKETKQTSNGLDETSLRPRLGVPRALRQDFIAAAIAAFATFAVLGFYSALIPSLLTQSMHVAHHAVAGAIVGGLFLIALSAIIVVPRIEPSRGMSYGLAALIPATIGLVAADRLHSLWLLIITTAVAGAAGGLGCLFGQQILTERAPEEQRAEVISAYLLVCYAGLSLPVIGVGVLGSASSPALAHLVFGGVVTLLAVAALLYEIFGRPRPSPRPERAPAGPSAPRARGDRGSKRRRSRGAPP